MAHPDWFDAALAEGRPRDHWEEQAALATDYALARPASDATGFFTALRERSAFIALAELSPPSPQEKA